MNKELFEDVKIEYIYFDNCDILCTSVDSELDTEISQEEWLDEN